MHLSHLYHYSLPGVNPTLRVLMRSYFLCSLNIVVNYNGLYRADAAAVGLFARSIAEPHEWFEHSLDYALENTEYYSYYRNLNSLLKLMIDDGVKVYLMPFARKEDQRYVEEWGNGKYVELNAVNNNISYKLTKKYSQVWIPLETDSIPKEAWLSDRDDCHFNATGNLYTAKFVAKFIQPWNYPDSE